MFIILILSIILILIIYRNTLLKDKNFLFEFQYKQNLEREKNVFVYIVNFSLFFI